MILETTKLLKKAHNCLPKNSGVYISLTDHGYLHVTGVCRGNAAGEGFVVKKSVYPDEILEDSHPGVLADFICDNLKRQVEERKKQVD